MDEFDSLRSRFLHEDSVSLASSSTEPSNIEGQLLSLSLFFFLLSLSLALVCVSVFLCNGDYKDLG